jgi:hypothetical protein
MATAQNKQTITVKTDEQNPEPLELIAQSIIEVAEAFQKINNSRLKRRAILVLLKDITGLGMREIELILDTAPELKDYYTKQLPKP